jgi:hypothetical protein
MPGEPVVAKSVNAAFIGTDLDLRLRRLGAQQLVVFGISTDMCVSTKIRVGANLGWRMMLVEDACDCFDLRPYGRYNPGRRHSPCPCSDPGLRVCNGHSDRRDAWWTGTC